MKLLVIASLLTTLLWSVSCGKVANAANMESLRAINLSNRELEASKTSIVAYNKTQMAIEDVEKEAERLEAKCEELGSPCHVIILKSIGVFEIVYETPNHPSTGDLELDSAKEIGVEDVVVNGENIVETTDPEYHMQWYYHDYYANINVQEGWSEYLSDAVGGDPNGPSVVIAVLDTGIDYTHPDLVTRMWANTGEITDNGIDDDGNGIIDDYFGADFTVKTSGTGDPIDRHSHGTHCAGVIAAEENNGKGIAGVASFTQGKVKLMAVKVLDDFNQGTFSSILAGMNYAIEMGARITSASLGAPGNIASYFEPILDQVLQNNPDQLLVAAAMNDALEINDDYRPFFCGVLEPNLLCVASSRWDYQMSSFSNYGEKYVQVMAPGSAIYSTIPGGSYQYKWGTSMATPMVSGLAGLVMTMRDDFTGAEVREIIEANVATNENYDGLVSTKGCIDVGATIKAVKDTTSK